MNNHLLKFAAITALGVTLASCGSDNDATPTEAAVASYDVTVTNLTAGQPFSPIAVVSHTSDIRLFTVGDVASTELEQLAEGGDNTALITSLDSSSEVLSTQSAEGPLPPGNSVTFSVNITLDTSGAVPLGTNISGVTMLVNTNDAITGFQGIDVSGLAVGERTAMNTISYDTGTEADTEGAGTMPGPADQGEGFNATRDDDINQILVHPGVVTSDDGLLTSRLLGIHRWDNPVARVVITRTQ